MHKSQDVDIEWLKTKIYEILETSPEPLNYSSEIPWILQNQIAGTNGMHYISSIGKLKKIPEYELPVPEVNGHPLFLDIGSGWGRWLLSAGNKGYVPIGIDLRLQFAQTQQKVLRQKKMKGYSIVADLENIPLQDGIFDLVWSFSVLQHTHLQRLIQCLQHIRRILSDGGKTILQLPNKNGWRNRYHYLRIDEEMIQDYNSWVVRYYSPKEYKTLFNQVFGNHKSKLHSTPTPKFHNVCCSLNKEMIK